MASDLIVTGRDAVVASEGKKTAALRMAGFFIRQIVVEGREDTLPKLPTKTEREVMQAGLVELEREVTLAGSPEGKATAAKMLGELFSGYPSLRNADAGEMVATYRAHLRGVPIAALRSAIDMIIQGRVPKLDPDWPPTAPRIHQIVADYEEPIWRNVFLVRKVLAVKRERVYIAPEKQKAMADKLASLAKEIGDRAKQKAYAENEERAAKRRSDNERMLLREYARLGIEPVRDSAGGIISPALAGKVG